MWNDETTEQLTRLHKEGLSSSQIAWRLGPSFTRCAVIGKISRLNLNGLKDMTPEERQERKRARSINSVGRTLRRSRLEPKLAEIPPAFEGPQGGNAPSMPSLKRPDRQPAKLFFRPDPKPRARAPEPPPEGHVSLMQLTAKTCRWPIGEVGKEGFCFCGGPPKENSPYCEHHAAKAYQPLQDRQKFVPRRQIWVEPEEIRRRA